MKTDEIAKDARTILLVDDENMVAEVCSRMLEKMGYQVLVAHSGVEAVGLYESHRDAVDLVILDMMMPDMSGSETFDRLQALDPGVRVVLSSGYVPDSQTAEILNKGCRGFIQKPMTMGELSQKLQEVFRS